MGVRECQPSGQIMYGPGRSESMFDHITSRMRETIILIIWKNKSSILNISAVVLFCNFQDLKFILKGIIPILVRSFVTGGKISKVFCNIIYRRKHRVFVWSLNGFFYSQQIHYSEWVSIQYEEIWKSGICFMWSCRYCNQISKVNPVSHRLISA